MKTTRLSAKADSQTVRWASHPKRLPALESRWLLHARAHLGHLFPYLPLQPGYNKRLREAAALITVVIRVLAVDTSLWADDVWVVDSTPVECGRSNAAGRRRRSRL